MKFLLCQTFWLLLSNPKPALPPASKPEKFVPLPNDKNVDGSDQRNILHPNNITDNMNNLTRFRKYYYQMEVFQKLTNNRISIFDKLKLIDDYTSNTGHPLIPNPSILNYWDQQW